MAINPVASRTSVLIRRAREDDRASVGQSWWQPDGWREGGRSLVQESQGHIVGAALRTPNRVHPQRDSAWLHLTPAASPLTLLDALRVLGGVPLALKARPGSVEHQAVLDAGGQPYQHCPPELVPTGTEALRTWCTARESAGVQAGVSLISAATWPLGDMVAAWTSLYEVVHASWSPTADRATLLEVFAPMMQDELDAQRTVLALVNGDLVAACFVFTQEGASALEAITEAVLPQHPRARDGVGAVMARVLSQAAGTPVEFDGHRSDPHFFALLQDLPEVQSGSTPLDLLELRSPGALTAGE